MTPTDAARAAGLPSANALYNFLHGRSSALSQQTVEALAQAIPGATIAALVGVDVVDNIGAPQRPIVVRAKAAAGLMQRSFDLPPHQQHGMVTAIPEEWHAQGVFGIEVYEPGAELLFPSARSYSVFRQPPTKRRSSMASA